MRCGVVDGEEYVSDLLDAGRDIVCFGVRRPKKYALKYVVYDILILISCFGGADTHTACVWRLSEASGFGFSFHQVVKPGREFVLQ